MTKRKEPVVKLDDAEAAHRYRLNQARNDLRKAGFEPVSPGSDIWAPRTEIRRDGSEGSSEDGVG